MMPQQGTPAPDFELPDQDGKTHKLSEFKGKWVLVYFYPKDDTTGCTTEACMLRDNLPKFNSLDAVVLGISTDSVASHKAFANKYGLPFTLLSDEKKEAVKLYGVDGVLGTKRSSFLINPQGIIAKVYEKVIPAMHAGEVLDDLEKLKR